MRECNIMIEPTVTATSEVMNRKSEKTIGDPIEQNVAAELTDHYNPSVREVNIPKLANGSCGFDLSRSKWDPYPWVYAEYCTEFYVFI